MLTSAEFTTAGEDPGSAAASYGATAAAPLILARILPTAGGALSGGVDDYAYTAGEVGAGYTSIPRHRRNNCRLRSHGWINGLMKQIQSCKSRCCCCNLQTRKDCIAFVSPWNGAQIATSGGAALTEANQLELTPLISWITLLLVLTLLRIVELSTLMIVLTTSIVISVAMVTLLVFVFLLLSLMIGSLQQELIVVDYRTLLNLAFNPNKAQR